MDQQSNIMTKKWLFRLSNIHVCRFTVACDSVLFIAVFIEQAVRFPGLILYIISSLVVLFTECFQTLLGIMVLLRRFERYQVQFLKHYITMKVVFLIFFLLMNFIYIPIVCRDHIFRENHTKVCNYNGFYLGTSVAVLAVELIFLYIISRMYWKFTKQHRNGQLSQAGFVYREQPTRNILDIEYEEALEGLVVECKGVPLTTFYSKEDLMAFNISVTKPLAPKKKKSWGHGARKREIKIEQIDLEQHFKENNSMHLKPNNVEKTRANEREPVREQEEVKLEITDKQPSRARRFKDIYIENGLGIVNPQQGQTLDRQHETDRKESEDIYGDILVRYRKSEPKQRQSMVEQDRIFN